MSAQYLQMVFDNKDYVLLILLAHVTSLPVTQINPLDQPSVCKGDLVKTAFTHAEDRLNVVLLLLSCLCYISGSFSSMMLCKTGVYKACRCTAYITGMKGKNRNKSQLSS